MLRLATIVRQITLSVLIAGLGGGLVAVPTNSWAGEFDQPFHFVDVGDAAGVFPALAGIRGHGAAWGDVDGDGWLDLYVATFHVGSSRPSLLLRNRNGQFHVDPQPTLQLSLRGTGVVFADLDNDGDLDLYVGSMPAAEGTRLARQEGHTLRGCCLLRNDRADGFKDVSEESGACPVQFGGRSVAVVDYDGDGWLDLLVGEDPHPGYNGSPTKSTRLFRNLGHLRFEDVSCRAGIPPDVPGLGVAAADVNNDSWPDLFIAASDGGNVLLLNDGRGQFRVDEQARRVFAWSDARGDNMVCGIAFGDVNRDGWLDAVLGQHYDHPWRSPVFNRLYANRGVQQGRAVFEDVTEQVGLEPLAMKAPHVEIQDFDNDGWPDLYQSVVKFAGGHPFPIIFRNMGVHQETGLPLFTNPAWKVNDFPNQQHRTTTSNQAIWDRLIREKLIFYAAPGPVADWDNDGRLEMFLPSWWPESRSLLLRNETPSGNWLKVRIDGGKVTNRMGIGSRVNVYPAGKLADRSSLLGCCEIAVGYGYASGQPAYAHFGLGDHETVDVEIILPHGKGTITRRGVGANRWLMVSAEDP